MIHRLSLQTLLYEIQINYVSLNSAKTSIFGADKKTLPIFLNDNVE